MTRIDPERLALIERIDLGHGNHTGPADGACLLEAVAYVAGEQWGDAPACASPAIAGFLRTWNDLLDTRPRQTLKRYIVRLAGSRGTHAQEHQRRLMLLDWHRHIVPQLPRGRRGRWPAELALDAALNAHDGHPDHEGLMPVCRVIAPVTLAAAHELVDRLLAITETAAVADTALDEPAPTATARPPAPTPERTPVTRRPRQPAANRPRLRLVDGHREEQPTHDG